MEKDNGFYLEKEMRAKDAEIERINAEIARLREALQDIFDYECQFSSTSLIACTAKDALAGEEKK